MPALALARHQGFGALCGCDCSDALDFDFEPLGGGSCSTGRGVVCACAEDASLGRAGGDGAALGAAAEALAVERLGRVPLVDGDAELLEDELNSLSRLVAVGGVTPQSVLPLDAVFGRSLQWSA